MVLSEGGTKEPRVGPPRIRTSSATVPDPDDKTGLYIIHPKEKTITNVGSLVRTSKKRVEWLFEVAMDGKAVNHLVALLHSVKSMRVRILVDNVLRHESVQKKGVPKWVYLFSLESLKCAITVDFSFEDDPYFLYIDDVPFKDLGLKPGTPGSPRGRTNSVIPTDVAKSLPSSSKWAYKPELDNPNATSPKNASEEEVAGGDEETESEEEEEEEEAAAKRKSRKASKDRKDSKKKKSTRLARAESDVVASGSAPFSFNDSPGNKRSGKLHSMSEDVVAGAIKLDAPPAAPASNRRSRKGSAEVPGPKPVVPSSPPAVTPAALFDPFAAVIAPKVDSRIASSSNVSAASFADNPFAHNDSFAETTAPHNTPFMHGVVDPRTGLRANSFNLDAFGQTLPPLPQPVSTLDTVPRSAFATPPSAVDSRGWASSNITEVPSPRHVMTPPGSPHQLPNPFAQAAAPNPFSNPW